MRKGPFLHGIVRHDGNSPAGLARNSGAPPGRVPTARSRHMFGALQCRAVSSKMSTQGLPHAWNDGSRSPPKKLATGRRTKEKPRCRCGSLAAPLG